MTKFVIKNEKMKPENDALRLLRRRKDRGESSLRRWFMLSIWYRICGYTVVGQYGRLRLVQSSLAKADLPFAEYIREALALIERIYPRGYRRIEREIYQIVNAIVTPAGAYNRLQRTCQINFDRYERVLSDPPTYREWQVASLATTLIHEATHGHLATRGIPYNKKTRARCEKICVREEERFVARLHSDQYNFETLVTPFDEANWHFWWNRSFVQKVRDVVQKLEREGRL